MYMQLAIRQINARPAVLQVWSKDTQGAQRPLRESPRSSSLFPTSICTYASPEFFGKRPPEQLMRLQLPLLNQRDLQKYKTMPLLSLFLKSYFSLKMSFVLKCNGLIFKSCFNSSYRKIQQKQAKAIRVLHNFVWVLRPVWEPLR